ncbi:MAG: Ig-like domain repeat protein [Aeromicrobium sp.]
MISSTPPSADRHRPRIRRGTVQGAVMALVVAALPALAIASPSQAATPQTTISLTFDDGNADQIPAATALASRGMKGTFYVNSGTIGQDGFLTRANLDALAAAGHEIAGHTVTHPSLPTLPTSEAKRQICLDRNTLIDWGFSPRSFAYPFAETSAALQTTVQECGYNSARNLGDLKTRFGGTNNLYAETTPPPKPYETRALDQVDNTWTLQDFKDAVTNAETHGGGWVQFTFHNICTTTCGELAVTQTLLTQFLDWLDAREATNNTVVKTVGDVIGGNVKAKVAVLDPPPITDASGLTNPGFETINAGGQPECWMKGGFGTNTSLFDTVTPGHTGTRAGRLTVTEYADGDAKLLPALDLGTCSPGAAAGKAYNLTAWYTSTATTQYDVYIRDTTGAWKYWDSSPYFSPQTDWTLASWTTGVIPEGYTGISFGLNLFSNGVLTVDDYGITAGTATAPTTTATVAPAAPTATGWYTAQPTVTLTKTGGAAGWSLQYSLDGTTWLPYTTPFPVPDGVTIVSYRSRGAGDYAEATKTLTLKVDSTKPTVAPAFDTATRKLSATGADATSGIDRIERSTDGGATWTAFSPPVTLPDAPATFQFRAFDKAGNVSATETISVKKRQAASTVGLAVASPKTYGKAAAARVTVTAAAGSPTPTGDVVILVDGRPLGSSRLTGGIATALLPADLRAGQHTVTAAYAGDAETEQAASAPATLTVQRALPTVSAKLASSRIKAGSRPTVKATISVPGTGIRPTGLVEVRIGKKVVKRVTLRASDRGRVTIRLPKVSRKGIHRVKVTFAGSSDIRSRTSRAVTLRVR